MKKCRDLMTKYVKMCRTECTSRDAVQIMKELNCGVVPVVNENNQIQGIVTDRDVVMYNVLQDKDPDKSKVKEFMSHPVITCHADDDIDSAIEKMKNYKIRRIPVIDEDEKIIGIISLGDVAVMAHEEHETFEALGHISEPVSGAK